MCDSSHCVSCSLCLEISRLFPPSAPSTVVTGWALMQNKQMAFLCHIASCHVPTITQWCIISGKQHKLAPLNYINITTTENRAKNRVASYAENLTSTDHCFDRLASLELLQTQNTP